MELSQQLAFTVAQQGQRIGAVEELLRRSEATVAAVLGRVKDVELALNTVHAAVAHVAPQVAAANDDTASLRQRVDYLEGRLQAWVQQGPPREGLTGPLPEPSDVAALSALRRDVTALQAATAKLTVSLDGEGRALQRLDKAHDWLTEQLRAHIAAQRDASSHVAARVEQVAAVAADAQRRADDSNDGGRTAAEAVARDTQGAVAGLRADVTAAVVRLRQETEHALAQTAGDVRSVDDETKALETVLRGEIQARLGRHDELVGRLAHLEERQQQEVAANAHYTRALDEQLGQAFQATAEAAAVDTDAAAGDLHEAVAALTEHVAGIDGAVAEAGQRSEDEAEVQQRYLEELEVGLREGLRQELAEMQQRSDQSTEDLRAAIETEVAEALQRRAAEGPEHTQLHSDVAALQSATEDLTQRLAIASRVADTAAADGRQAVEALLDHAALQGEVAALRSAVAARGPTDDHGGSPHATADVDRQIAALRSDAERTSVDSGVARQVARLEADLGPRVESLEAALRLRPASEMSDRTASSGTASQHDDDDDDDDDHGADS